MHSWRGAGMRRMGAQSTERNWTVLELLNWTTRYFKNAGIERPRLNAELLLSKVLGLERIMLYARFGEVVGEVERAQFRALVRKRAARFPLQYLLGRTEFYGRPFEVSPAVMVPRQETELVVEKCLQKLPGTGAGRLCCDIGTGSGVIAVTLAAERAELDVIATDSSAQALDVAKRNAEAHGVAGRISFVCGNLAEPVLETLAAQERPLALFVSNPPYVPTAEIESLEPEVRDYEPRNALDGGPDGLRVIRDLVGQAARALHDGGWLVLELGEGQAGAVVEMIEEAGGLRMDSIELEKDGSGSLRVLAAQMSAQGRSHG